MKKILYTFINIIMFGTVLRAQTTTFPRNGVQDERPNTYAFVNATIVSDANTVLEGATLVIKGSVIEAVGKNITLPAGTQVIDLKGKRIYPSLVEAYSSYGMPELKKRRT
jgi:cytosine/adenosine deaminase-related metal-dependent hydrolase